MRTQVTVVTSAALVVLGLAMIVRTIVAGGGAIAFGILVGALFVCAGAGRIWVARKTR